MVSECIACSNLETLIHLVKCSLGTGILAMPQAYARAGMVTGVVGTVVAGVIVTHCLYVLVRMQYFACKRRRVPLLSYPDAMAESMRAGPPCLHGSARLAASTVDLFLVVYQLGICCVYILLAPFSALANALILLGLAIIVYYLVGTTGPARPHEPMNLWGTPITFPLFFGTILFALTAVGVVTPCGVLNVGMSLIVVLYVAIGALGYSYCGATCSDSITLDLPPGPLATSVIVMFVVAIFISYVLHCFVPVEVVWSYVSPRLAPDSSPGKLRCAKTALRVCLCLLT
ncbi:Amino acid transporter, partial [Operophtera brumata]